jgi:L-iditol 2-dehydrogenase
MDMLAAVFHGPDDLRVEQVPRPSLPQGGLVMRTRTVGICGSDVRTWHAGNHRFSGSQILGHEMGGIVTESDVEAYPVGTPITVCPCVPCLECASCLSGHQNFCRGRKCFGYQRPGGMAEAMAVPGDAIRASCVVKVPDSIPLDYAPLAETLHSILNGQDRARTSLMESVLVLGLGPVGILHVAVASSRGARPVLGVDPLGQRVEAAGLVLGPGRVLQMGEGWEKRARELTDGRGWDVVVIANVARASVATAFSLVAPMGRIVAYAGLRADAPYVDVDWNDVHYRQIEIIGSFGGTPVYFRSAVDWLASSNLPLDRLITSEFPIERTLEAFNAVENGVGVKTVLRLS